MYLYCKFKFQKGKLPSFYHPNKSFHESEMLMDLLLSNCKENYRSDPLEECIHICTTDCLPSPYHASPHNLSSELWYQHLRPLEVETQNALSLLVVKEKILGESIRTPRHINTSQGLIPARSCNLLTKTAAVDSLGWRASCKTQLMRDEMRKMARQEVLE